MLSLVLCCFVLQLCSIIILSSHSISLPLPLYLPPPLSWPVERNSYLWRSLTAEARFTTCQVPYTQPRARSYWFSKGHFIIIPVKTHQHQHWRNRLSRTKKNPHLCINYCGEFITFISKRTHSQTAKWAKQSWEEQHFHQGYQRKIKADK